MSTFNDDLSADMNDPEFAAEFERVTDDVRLERCTCGETACESDLCDCDSRPCPVDHAAEYRRERYAVAIREFFGTLPYVSVLIEHTTDAAMALADEEIRVAKMEATQIITRRWSEESVRTNRLIQDLRSDLQESADALDESAQLLEDALDENTRLREKTQFFADAWERATRADFEKAQENERLRAELERVKKAAKIITENRWYERLGRAEDTISRVRDVLPSKSDRQELGLPNDLAYNAGEHDMADAVREILNGEI